MPKQKRPVKTKFNTQISYHIIRVFQILCTKMQCKKISSSIKMNTRHSMKVKQKLINKSTLLKTTIKKILVSKYLF